jgi:hypothetical protein
VNEVLFGYCNSEASWDEIEIINEGGLGKVSRLCAEVKKRRMNVRESKIEVRVLRE